MLKCIILLIVFFVSVNVYAQYNPALHNTASKAYGSSQAFGTDARSMYFDNVNFVYRAFVDTTEVWLYLNQAKYRTGMFPIVVNTGGTLNGSGVITGGTNRLWYYKDGTNRSNLVPMDNILSVNGQVGTVVTKNADSIKGKPIDTTIVGSKNNYILSYDSTNGTWKLTPPATAYAQGTGIIITGTTIAADNTTALWNANAIRGRSITSGTPSVGNTITWNGTSWIYSSLNGLDTAYLSNDTLYLVNTFDTIPVVIKTIYNADDTLQGNRIVHTEDFNLEFNGKNSNINLVTDNDDKYITVAPNGIDIRYGANTNSKGILIDNNPATVITDAIDSIGLVGNNLSTAKILANDTAYTRVREVRQIVGDSSGNYIRNDNGVSTQTGGFALGAGSKIVTDTLEVGYTSAGKSVIGGTTSQVGNLFYDFFKDRTTIGYNYTTATPNATITLDGEKMVISGGVGNSNNYITRNYYIGGETWTQTIRGKVNTVNSTSYGIIMGMVGSTFSIYAIFGMDNSSGNLGKILLQTSLGSTFQTSSGAATVSAGDSIILTMSRSHNVLTVTYQDITSGTSSSTTYNFSYSSGTNSFPNTGTPRLYIYGGSQNINYWAVTNTSTKNIPVLGIGNSIMAGHFAGSVGNRYMNQIFSSDYSKFSIDAGPSDNMANVVSKLPEIASFGASYLLIDIGTNNIGAGQSVAAFTTEYTAMLLKLLAMNSKVVLCAVTPRNAVDVTPYNTAISAIASLYGLKYIDIFTPLASGTNLNASYDAGDGLHINGAGNTVIASTITAAAPELLTADVDYNLIASNKRTAINNPTQFNDTVSFNNNVVISVPLNDNDSSFNVASTEFVKRNVSSSNYFINNNGTATQSANFKINGKGTALQFSSLPATNISAAGGGADFMSISANLVATANNDVLSGITINPSFNNGAFGNVRNYALQILNGDAVFANGVYFNMNGSDSRNLFVNRHIFQSNAGVTTGSLYRFWNATSSGLTGDVVKIDGSNTDASGNMLNILGASNIQAFVVKGSGSVGINTTNPGAFGLNVQRSVVINQDSATRVTSLGTNVIALIDTSNGKVQTITGANLATAIGATSYTFSTGLTNSSGTVTNNLSTGVSGGQTLIGSTSTNSGITYKATTGIGTTGADHIFTGGNNGATEFMRILNNGNVGIGITSPTARLHLPAGTATANTAPLKFTTTNNLLTTPEEGAMEYYNSKQITFTNGSIIRQEIPLMQQRRLSVQFDKTNTTLADVTGLSVDVAAAGIYRFTATLHVDADATGGHKYTIAGTATATNIIYQVNSIDNTAGFKINSRKTSLGSSVGEASGTQYYTTIEGVITVNAAGTLTVQFAQNAATGTSSVLVGSNFVVTQLN